MTEEQAITEALAALGRMDEDLATLHSVLPVFKQDGGYAYYGQQLEELLGGYRAYLEGLKGEEN